MMRWHSRIVVALAVAAVVGLADPAWAGLVSGPTAETVDGQVVIRFQVRAATDVEVSILDGQGRVVRHLAAGVLGGAAPPPAPLAAGLTQALTWDGKDDGGNLVRFSDQAGGPFKARVRLGLRPAFDRFIAAAPENQGTPVGLGCDPAGNLYVMSTWSAPNQHYPGMELKSFDRDGRYRRQIMPYPAGLPAERLAGVPRLPLADGTSVPLVYHGANQSVHPQAGAGGRQSIVVRPDGKLATTNMPMGDGPYGFDHATRRVLVMGADGSVGADYLGPLIARREWRGGSYIMLALSPDGATIYAAGYRDNGAPVPAVTRATWDAAGEPEVFLGDPAKAAAEPAGLVEPRGLAVDREGNLYVCDNAAGRVAVFSPAGRLIGQIPVEHPDHVAVHRRTGKVYVLTIKPDPARNRGGNWGQGHNWNAGKRLLMFKDRQATAPLATLELPTGPVKTFFCLDDSAEQGVLWLGPIAWGNWNVARIVDRGEAFGPMEYPIRDRVPAGALAVGYLDFAVDRNTEEVWVGRIAAQRFAGRSGEYLGAVRFENEGRQRMHYGHQWGDFVFSADGRTLLYQPAYKWHFRYDRQGNPAPWPASPSGERLAHEVDGDLEQGFMHPRGLAAARDGGFYVLHHREHRTFNDGRVSQVGPDGTIARSEIVKTDVPVGGIRVGRDGHIYVGVHLKPAGTLLPEWFEIFPGGHLLPPRLAKTPAGWGTAPGQLPPEITSWYVEQYGSVVRFRPEGGRLVFDPDGAYFAPNIGGERAGWSPEWPTAKGSIKAEGVDWMWYGLAPIPSRRGTSRTLGGPRCNCQTARFDLDGHDRLYVPDTFRFGVAVLDAAGNLITRFGQYGNQDDPAEGANIPLAWPHAVAASNEAVYVADMVNRRLVRVRLDAGSEATCDLPRPAPGAAR